MYFKKATHQYIVNGKPYKSFSTIIKLVEPEKDWDEIATKYAKKNKMAVEDVRKQWAEEGKSSREKGTMFHSLKEIEVLGSSDKPVFYEDNDSDIREIRPLENLEDGIYPELILYNNEYQACGTADKVTIETIDGIRYVDIEDYKTSKKIDLESYYNPKMQEYDKLKSPLNSVMDSNYWKYALQLSMYAYFLEKYNFTPRRLTLIHLKVKERTSETEVEYLSSSYQIDYNKKQYYIAEEKSHDVPYLKKEVRSLLQHHKSKL